MKGDVPVSEVKRQQIKASIRASKEIAELPKADEWKTDGGYVRNVVERILEICERYGMLPTIAQLGTAMGVAKSTLDDVRSGYVVVNPDVKGAVDQYYGMCENLTVTSTMDGSTNGIVGIFLMKSQFGYKEEPREVVIQHNKLIGERKDPAAIAQRYADAVVVDAKEVKALPDGGDQYGW